MLILLRNGVTVDHPPFWVGADFYHVAGQIGITAQDGWSFDQPLLDEGPDGEPVLRETVNWSVEALPVIEPEPLTPEQVRMRMPALTPPQFRIMLLEDLGIDEAEMDSRIAAIPDQTIRNRTHIYWKHATEFRRTDALLVTAVESLLSKTQAEADVIWMDFLGRFAGGA